MPRIVPDLKIFGIAVRANASFPLLVVLVTGYYTHRYGVSVGSHVLVFLLCLFALVLAHELTHSLTAVCFGIRVPVITLTVAGGVATMDRIPREPKKEFLIAAAGPLFNFVLAGLAYFPISRTLGARALFSPDLSTWSGALVNLYWANLVLGLFNLIPAFPMDGGRILRSALSGLTGYRQATKISIFLGHFFAILFALLGLWSRHWMLTVVGVYLFRAASREKRQSGA